MSSTQIAARRRTPDTVVDWWREILAPSAPVPPVARLLGRHPGAEALTDDLLEGLTVAKLVRIANVAHNRCRLSYIPDDLREEVRAQIAWDLMGTGMRQMAMRDNTAWTDTVALLSQDVNGAASADDAILQLRSASIHRLLAACERLINRPYRAARTARHVRWR